MFDVLISEEARTALVSLPAVVQARVLAIIERLRHWPDVSGAKRLRGTLKGAWRIRTGDYRVLFTVDEPAQRIVLFRIAHRSEVYE